MTLSFSTHFSCNIMIVKINDSQIRLTLKSSSHTGLYSTMRIGPTQYKTGFIHGEYIANLTDFTSSIQGRRYPNILSETPRAFQFFYIIYQDHMVAKHSPTPQREKKPEKKIDLYDYQTNHVKDHDLITNTF